MDWYVILGITFGLLLLGLFSGMPITFGMGMAGLVPLVLMTGTRLLEDFGLVAWNNLNSFVLTAIPLYVLMGNLLVESGMLKLLYDALTCWVHRIPGRLLQTNILACTVFASISGSSVANAATMSRIAIPEQLKMNYERKITFGSVAAGGCLGILIPPSGIMIIYGAMTETSVGQLFMAGVIPGLILSAFFMITIGVWTRWNPKLIPLSEGSYTWKMRIEGLKVLLPIFVLVFIILGGIYGGILTPTEAAGVSVVVALIIVVSFGKLNREVMSKSLLETARLWGSLGIIIVGANIVGFSLSIGGVIKQLSVWIMSLHVSPLSVIIILTVIYTILGCLIEGMSMMIMTLPIVFPVIRAFGIDPVWFGIFMVLMLELALVTPPVGLNLFVIKGTIPDSTLNEIARGVAPFYIGFFLLLVLLVAFPKIALWLPSVMVRR